MNPAFERYIGIDYSGAQSPTSSLTLPQGIDPWYEPIVK
jgi:hypothetical protein